ncbi:unnamed protein product, partial [Symbiodinium necroappetens]
EQLLRLLLPALRPRFHAALLCRNHAGGRRSLCVLQPGFLASGVQPDLLCFPVEAYGALLRDHPELWRCSVHSNRTGLGNPKGALRE